MSVARLLDRRVLFFGGKGGVGKTTLAAAVALHAAEGGQRTLLVSTDPAHSTGDLLEVSLGPDPREAAPDLWAIEIDPAREADCYIRDVKDRIAASTPPRLVAEVERQIDIARLTPGAEESALFDRFARILEEDAPRYDRLVFDTAPLGHTLRLLALPEHMHTWMNALIGRRRKVNALGRMWRRVAGTVPGDPGAGDRVLEALEARRARFERVRATLTDSTQAAFVLVVVPERLPILETARAASTLDRYGIPVGAVVVNRVLPADAEGVFLARRREREGTYRAQITEQFGRYPVLHAALQDADVVGREALRRLLSSLH